MSAFKTGNKLRVGPNGEKLTNTALTTWTHKVFDIADPSPDAVCVEDIAHGLSQHVRWAGQGKWLSVAQHSVMVVRKMEEEISGYNHHVRLLRYAMMHDAHEAYIGDLSGGLKYLLGSSILPVIVQRIDQAIHEAIPGVWMFPLKEHHEAIKRVEQELVAVEYDVLFHGKQDDLIEGPLCQRLSEELFLSEAARLGIANAREAS